MKLDKYTVAVRYAKAYFLLAEKKGCLEQAFDNMMDLRQIFQNNPGLGSILTDARLTLQEKRPIVATLTEYLPELMQNFVQMVFDYGRMEDMELIIDEFEKLYDLKKGTILATAKTAVPLTEEQMTKLSDAFAKKMNATKVMLTNIVEPSLLGGVIIEAGDLVFDGSIKTNLEKLQKQMNN